MLVIVEVRKDVNDKLVSVEMDEGGVDMLLSEVIVVEDDTGPDPDVEVVGAADVSVPESDCEIVGVDKVLDVDDDVIDPDPSVDVVVVVGAPELVSDSLPDEVSVTDDVMLVVVALVGALVVKLKVSAVVVELDDVTKVNVPLSVVDVSVSMLATMVKLPVREVSVGSMVGVSTGYGWTELVVGAREKPESGPETTADLGHFTGHRQASM